MDKCGEASACPVEDREHSVKDVARSGDLINGDIRSLISLRMRAARSTSSICQRVAITQGEATTQSRISVETARNPGA